MRRYLVVAVMLCLLATVMTAANAASLAPAAANAASTAPAAASITLAPNPLALNVNDTGSVNVQISNAQNLGAFEFIIAFDPAVVNAVLNGVTLGPMLNSSNTYTAYLLGPLVNNTSGTIRFAAYTLGSGAGPNGSGILASMQIKGIHAGTSSLTFTKVRITDRSAVMDNGVTATNGVVIVGSGSGPRIWLPSVSK